MKYKNSSITLYFILLSLLLTIYILGFNNLSFDAQVIEEIIVEDYITSESIISDNNWHQYVIRFEPNGDPNECANEELAFGNLSVFVDGYRKIFIKNLREFNHEIRIF